MLFEDFQGIEPKAKINPQNENIAHICWVKCLGFFFFFFCECTVYIAIGAGRDRTIVKAYENKMLCISLEMDRAPKPKDPKPVAVRSSKLIS